MKYVSFLVDEDEQVLTDNEGRIISTGVVNKASRRFYNALKKII